jgi:hypothetical protein
MSVPDERTDTDGPAIRNGVRSHRERTYIAVTNQYGLIKTGNSLRVRATARDAGRVLKYIPVLYNIYCLDRTCLCVCLSCLSIMHNGT